MLVVSSSPKSSMQLRFANKISYIHYLNNYKHVHVKVLKSFVMNTHLTKNIDFGIGYWVFCVSSRDIGSTSCLFAYTTIMEESVTAFSNEYSHQMLKQFKIHEYTI